MIKMFYNNDRDEIQVKTVLFSDGAIDFQILSNLKIAYKDKPLSIHIDPSVPAASVSFLVNMAVVEFCEKASVSIVDLKFDMGIDLHLPYLPFARADRPFGTQALSMLEHFVNGISSHSTRIFTVDAHNPNAMDKLCEEYGIDYVNHSEFLKLDKINMEYSDYDVLVAPDKGSREKVKAIADCHNMPVVVMDKVRNLDTGAIESLEITSGHEHIARSKCLIVDDICDYGGTFKWAASVLDDYDALVTELFVTHMIAPAGIEAVKTNHLRNVHYHHRVGGYRD